MDCLPVTVEMDMGRKVLTPAAAMEIKRLYGLVDGRGRAMYSQMTIASMLGVSETTVFRVINHGGAYGAVPELPTDEEAKASEERFKAANPELCGMDKLQMVAKALDAPRKAGVEMLEELDAGYPE